MATKLINTFPRILKFKNQFIQKSNGRIDSRIIDRIKHKNTDDVYADVVEESIRELNRQKTQITEKHLGPIEIFDIDNIELMLPPEEEGIIWIVSRVVALVAAIFTTRKDLIFPFEVTRNKDGSKNGCKSFGRYTPSFKIVSNENERGENDV